MECKIFRSC